MHKVQVLTARDVTRALERMAAELVEREGEGKLLYLVGIQTRGVPLAHRLQALLAASTGTPPPVGALDISLYRDDVGPWRPAYQQPVLRATELPISIDGRVVCLVDDVLYTGRTIRAAMDELVDFGRPRNIQLAVLVDRGLRELPIQADYSGVSISTTHRQIVEVRMKESDGRDEVVVNSP